MIKKVKNKILLAIIIVLTIISSGIGVNKVYSASITIDGEKIENDYDLAHYTKLHPSKFMKANLKENLDTTISINFSAHTGKTTIEETTAVCMYHRQANSDKNSRYEIVNVIDIEGRKATVNYKKSITNKKNAALAYSIYKQSQSNATIDRPGTWKNSIKHYFFENEKLKNEVSNKFIVKNENPSRDNTDKIKEAEKYANKCSNDTGAPSKVSTTYAKSGNYIGPFKMKKGGFIPTSIKIKVDDKDSEDVNCYYYDSSDKEYKKKDVEDLTNNKNFYIKYTGEIKEKWKVSLKFERYNARMILLSNPASTGQNLGIYTGEKENRSISWSGSTYGKIKITKKDADSKKAINGATFSITGPNNYSNRVTITNNGEVIVGDLKPGEYTIKEIAASPGYNLSLQTNTVKKVKVTNGSTSTVAFENRKYGNLKISKVDDYSKIPLEGVRFYVIYSKDDKWINVNGGRVFNFDDFESNNSYATNNKGEIEIKNLPTGYTYFIYEYGTNNEELSPYYDFNSYNWKEMKLKDSKDSNYFTEYYCENTQKYIDLSGYIWEDKVSGKSSISNDLYNDTDGDIDSSKVIGVKIELVNMQTGQVVTQRDGKYCSTTSVDRTNLKDGENLSYRFCGVPMYDESGNYILDKYYVRFEYNGLKYASVNVKKDQANGSKAKEVPTSRTELNNAFTSIENPLDYKRENSGTKGSSKNNNDKESNNLKYNSDTQWQSTLVQHTNYSPSLDNENGQYIQIVDSKGIGVESNTKEAEYNIERYKGKNIKDQLEVKNINLGIKEKEQVDLAIKNDISKITFKMNEYTHVYNYSQRDAFVQKDSNGELITDYEEDADKGYDKTLDGFLPEVKMDDKYKNMSYTREVYKTYPDCNKNTTDKSKKLKIYITYEIEIANHSNIQTIVNEITNYFDSDKLISLDSRQKEINENYREGYNKGIYEINLKIDPYKSKKTTLTFEVKDEAIQNLLNKDATIENVVEINKYTTASGSIDKDSAPNNADPIKIETYEDDTDRAPGLTIKTADIKSIKGTVFEDDITNFNESEKLHEGKERLGNGKYGVEDIGKVYNVKVDIIDKRTNDIAKRYDNGEIDATTKTDIYGNYEFKGLIPGEYILRYTYGDGNSTEIYYKEINNKKATTQDYKSTIVTSNILKNIIKGTENSEYNKNYWYLTDDVREKQYSVAYDNYERRQEINRKYENINYNLQSNYISDKIYADTPEFKVAIEDHQYEEGSEFGKNDFIHEYANMNFGIVERPRQSIEITKSVSYIKLTLANGQVIAEGDPRSEKLQYVSYPKGGTLKLEIDNEIIQGSTLSLRYEIKAKNHSELDYNSKNYYIFAEKVNGDLVNIKIDKIVDYLDEELVYDTKSIENNWERITSLDLRNYDEKDKESVDKNNIADNVYNIIEYKNNIFISNNNIKLQKIKPEDEAIATFDSNKILYNTVGDLEFENFTEIIKYSNSVGRFYEDYYNGVEGKSLKSIPGNYIPSKDTKNNTEETDSNYNYKDTTKYNNPTVAIIPPTGEKRIYYILGISCLVILTTGIIIIKKKVL